MRRNKILSKFEWYEILSPEFLFGGQGLQFWYPVHNRFGLPIEYMHRAITVTKIEFLRDTGIPAEWIRANPLVRRGSCLITGFDIDIELTRSFYWEAMRRRRVRDAGVVKVGRDYPAPPPRPFPLPALQLGFRSQGFGDDEPELVDWVSRQFRPTLRDRLRLQREVMRLEESYSDLFADLKLTAFPVRASA